MKLLETFPGSLGMKPCRKMVPISSLVQLILATSLTHDVRSQITHSRHLMQGQIREHTNVHTGRFDSYQPIGFKMCLRLCRSQTACLSITYHRDTLTCTLRSVDTSTVEVYRDVGVVYTEMNSWTEAYLYPCRHLACSKGAQCIQTRRGHHVCAAYETVFTSEEDIVPLEHERNILGFAASPVNRDITYYLLKSVSGRSFIAETNYKTTLWRSIRILGMPRANVSHAHFGCCQQSREFCLYMGISYSQSRTANRIYYVRHKDLNGTTSAYAEYYVIDNITGRCGVFFLIPRGKIYTVESAGGEGEGGTLHLLQLSNNTLRSVNRKRLVNVHHVTMISLTLDGLEMLVMMKNKSCYNVGPGVVGKLDTMCDEGLQLKKDAIYVVWSLDGINLLSLEHGQKGYQLRSYVRTKKKVTQ